MPFITSGPSLRRLPLFFAYCPDYAGVLAKRLEVRPKHWARVQKEAEEGLHEFGLGYLPPPESSSTLPADVPSSTPLMDGSLMVFRAISLDHAWKRIKEDIYYTDGVWDKEKCVVREFIKHEKYSD
ncbi:hypothetical protein BD324DRAFT_624531 [Kockovaella imperatae]|uniref:YCII-related domain-containing protein n=1 Tax=Kockovaella imperatae TaxID=4999 RepID=A0A1Y1UIU4_9TREE|nr:hypothetical protein BD324DRAFT_624531 [Kockovaella imperatae]ORX37025.1 hypothetical protein BD324DRAFT_624531 [Kockovaella imperatae]